ncbi:MAG TPA: type II secretion system F family protein [Terriglobia bacterium]|nr:type II secretion system F family protein [Terriglobia bacterium]
MLVPILVIVAFIVTFALATSFFFFFVETPLARRKMMTRLSALQEVSVRGEEVPEVLRKELLSDMPFLHNLLTTAPGIRHLKLFLEQAAIQMQVGKFVLIAVGLAFVGLLITLAIGLPIYLAVFGVALGGAIPFIVASIMRQQRFDKFEEQFPEAMDLLGRAVRAGHAFTTGFELIGKELPDPVGHEFRIAFQQQSLGLPLKEALGNLAVRMPLPDIRIFVSSLQIQRESGGNLGEILDTLSEIVRERFKLRRQIRIYTAEGRLSMYFLTAIPIVAFLALMLFQPDYLAPMLTDRRGHIGLAVAVILQVIGYFVINRIIKIKI